MKHRKIIYDTSRASEAEVLDHLLTVLDESAERGWLLYPQTEQGRPHHYYWERAEVEQELINRVLPHRGR
jgi:hypothetical protein